MQVSCSFCKNICPRCCPSPKCPFIVHSMSLVPPLFSPLRTTFAALHLCPLPPFVHDHHPPSSSTHPIHLASIHTFQLYVCFLSVMPQSLLTYPSVPTWSTPHLCIPCPSPHRLPFGACEGLMVEDGSWIDITCIILTFHSIPLGQPRGTGTGWVMDTRGITPVLPYLCMYNCVLCSLSNTTPRCFSCSSMDEE